MLGLRVPRGGGGLRGDGWTWVEASGSEGWTMEDED
jgi:hypothetical protein